MMKALELEALFNEHAEAVYRAVYRVTLDAQVSEDAVQEAFVKLITRPPKRQDNLVAWLKRVAVNSAIDGLRRSNRSKPLADHDPADQRGEYDANIHEAEFSDEVLAALKQLKADHRAAVLAVDRDGMSYQDAAALLGVKLNKLKTDLLRGRRALHRLLQGVAEKR